MTTRVVDTLGEETFDRPGAAEAIAWLPHRLASAIECGAEEGWSLLGPQCERRTTVVVGTGGSYPAADFIARALRVNGSPAYACFPLDAETPAPRMVAVTYSGRTPDIAEAIKRFRDGGGREVILVTGNENPDLADKADAVLVHRRDRAAVADRPERGFISFAATIAPCVSMLTAMAGRAFAEEALDAAFAATTTPEVDKLGHDLVTTERLDVIASGWAWPAALHMESTWTEASLGFLRLSESKNLAHGRYQSVLPSQRLLHLVLGPSPAEYEGWLSGMLTQELAQRRSYTALKTALPGAAGGIVLLVVAASLAQRVGAYGGQDISRPRRILEAGVRMYDWKW